MAINGERDDNSPHPFSRRDSVDAFKTVLAQNNPGAQINSVIPKYAVEHVYPFISGSHTLQSIDEQFDFFKSHLGHAVYSSRSHPQWAESVYPSEVIVAVENHFLDTEIFPCVYPERSRITSKPDDAIKLSDLTRFPRLISDYLKIDEAAYQRIISETDIINITVATAIATKQSPEALAANLERQSRADDEKYKPERDAKYERIKSGMDQIARKNVGPLMEGVHSAAAYRARQRLFADELGKATKSFNASAFGLDTVGSDFQDQWEDYVAKQVRELYFTQLLDRVFGRVQNVNTQPQSLVQRFLHFLGQ